MQLETDIPWSANAPYDPNEPCAQEKNDCPTDLSCDGSELVPYCVVPYVERLLKVRLPTSRVAIKAACSDAATSISLMQGHPSCACLSFRVEGLKP